MPRAPSSSGVFGSMVVSDGVSELSIHEPSVVQGEKQDVELVDQPPRCPRQPQEAMDEVDARAGQVLQDLAEVLKLVERLLPGDGDRAQVGVAAQGQNAVEL